MLFYNSLIQPGIIKHNVIGEKKERYDIKNQVSTCMIGVSSFCHGIIDSDISYNKYIVWVRNVSKDSGKWLETFLTS